MVTQAQKIETLHERIQELETCLRIVDNMIHHGCRSTDIQDKIHSYLNDNTYLWETGELGEDEDHVKVSTDV